MRHDVFHFMLYKNPFSKSLVFADTHSVPSLMFAICTFGYSMSGVHLDLEMFNPHAAKQVFLYTTSQDHLKWPEEIGFANLQPFYISRYISMESSYFCIDYVLSLLEFTAICWIFRDMAKVKLSPQVSES